MANISIINMQQYYCMWKADQFTWLMLLQIDCYTDDILLTFSHIFSHICEIMITLLN